MNHGTVEIEQRETKTRRDRGPARWALWHPLLFGAWPALFLYAENMGETRADALWTALALTVGGTAVVWLLTIAVLRDVRRAALVTSVLAVGLLMQGHVRNLLSDPVWLLGVWLALVAVGVFLAARSGPGLRGATRVAVTFAAALCLLSLVPVAVAKVPGAFRDTSASADQSIESQVGQWSGPGEPRDIYYLVFDRYASAQALEERFGFDNSSFIEAIEDRGFTVAPKSTANHLRTAQSVSSTLNLRYLHDLPERYGTDTGDMLPVYDLLADHEVGKVLRKRGYEYVHIGAWWEPTATNPQADYNWGYETGSNFLTTLRDTTILPEVVPGPAAPTAEERRRATWEGTLEQFDRLDEASRLEGPTFTFAHILLPHQPFVFDRFGRYQSIEDTKDRNHDDLFLEQLRYANRRLIGALDRILDVPEDHRPIILLQADEGPHPLRFLRNENAFDWFGATRGELREKMQILNAYHLPDRDASELVDDDITPVNSWRIVFNEYFGADLPLLEDRSFIFRSNSAVYDFREVSDIVRD